MTRPAVASPPQPRMLLSVNEVATELSCGRDTVYRCAVRRVRPSLDGPRRLDFLGIPVSTLHQRRYLGTGPEAYRVGKHLRSAQPSSGPGWIGTAVAT